MMSKFFSPVAAMRPFLISQWSAPLILFQSDCDFPGTLTHQREELAMKKKRFTEEQITFALRQAESGTSVEEVIRRLGVSEATFYRWKKKYAGLGVAEVRRLKQLEEENRKLKQLVADLSLDKRMLQDVLSKKW